MATNVGKILIVDDHPLVREGLKSLIFEEPDLVVCAETGSMKDARDLVRDTRPDVVIVDLVLEDGDGLELIRRLRSHDPHIKILVCSMRDDVLIAERAINAGARGYVNKHEAADNVVDAIRHVLDGKLWVTPEVLDRLLAGGAHGGGESRIGDLTDRELEVFWLIGQGRSTAKIADELHLSIKTVETHRQNIKRKLGVASAGELIRHAVQWDLERTT